MITIKDWLNGAQNKLSNASDSPRLDAELLVLHQLKVKRDYLYAYGEQVITTKNHLALDALLEARLQGKPIAYMTGKKHFWDFELLVNEHTLIPRADTELAVEQSLKLIADIKSPCIFDLGTGSGAIACAMAYERADAKVIASDINAKTLAIAKQNQERLKLNNITFLLSDWFEHFPKQKADLIISNPPYIAPECPATQKSVHQYEPHIALYAKDNGLAEIKKISKKSFDYLNKEGILLLEIGYRQYNDVASILTKDGYHDVQYALDIHGYKRVAFARK